MTYERTEATIGQDASGQLWITAPLRSPLWVRGETVVVRVEAREPEPVTAIKEGQHGR